MTNVASLMANGLHCPNGPADPTFVAIGNPDLISRRAHRLVPIPPGGTLSDYVPFYFTPKTPMLLNIKTGYHGIVQRPRDEIAILVSSCQALRSRGVTLLFTDRHAYAATADWTDDQSELAAMIDWDLLRRHDFARDENYPDKMERYQAEALAYRHVPPSAVLGIGCVSETVRANILSQLKDADVNVVVRPNWYF